MLRCGLDPWVGFFHQPHPGRASLTLDLMEEFRPFVDTLTLRLVNRQQLGPVDFERCCGEELAERLADEANGEHADADQLPGEGVYLAEAGRRIFLNQFFRRLRERLFYPPRQASYQLRDILCQQIALLARVLRGAEETYTAFVPA